MRPPRRDHESVYLREEEFFMNRLWLSGLAVLVAAWPCLAAETADASRDALAMAAKIDTRCGGGRRPTSAAAGRRLEVPRVYLDLAGRIPRSSRRDVLDDRSPDKHAAHRRLLDSPLTRCALHELLAAPPPAETNTNFRCSSRPQLRTGFTSI
jgi:hypothetical protein